MWKGLLVAEVMHRLMSAYGNGLSKFSVVSSLGDCKMIDSEDEH